MKAIPPRFPLPVIRYPFAIIALACAAVGPPAVGGPETTQNAPDPVSPAPGLLAQATRRARDLPSVSAKIRLRVNLYGQQLVGTGTYLQLRSRHHKKVRLELKIQVADQVTSLQQISDGRFLRTLRSFPGDSPRVVTEVDLLRVQKVLEKGRGGDLDTSAPWLALGGLTQLLRGLDADFVFDAPHAGTLRAVPVWILHGKWRPDRLAERRPDGKADAKSVDRTNSNRPPRPLPDSVLVLLGRDDLFPYRIEFRRRGTDELAGKKKAINPSASRAIVTMEFFEVSVGAPLDPLVFEFHPDLQVEDHTDRFLERTQ
jgi:hypothetical protein